MPSPSEQPAPPRVLIFGGTFDPPHRAHIELPQIAARELGCHRIIYIPAAINPLKMAPDAPPPTPASHRLAMLKLALQDTPNAEVSTIELERQGPSYTIDTLRLLVGRASPTTNGDSASTAPALGDAHPAFFLLIGADQALEFHRWKEWREILQLATPAVMLRPPWTRQSYVEALLERYDQREVELWMSRTLWNLPMIDVSATAIRQRLLAGESLTGRVPAAVDAYIRAHGLYARGE